MATERNARVAQRPSTQSCPPRRHSTKGGHLESRPFSSPALQRADSGHTPGGTPAQGLKGPRAGSVSWSAARATAPPDTGVGERNEPYPLNWKVPSSAASRISGTDPQDGETPSWPVSKIAESTLYQQILTVVEPHPRGSPYACRRERGTSLHVTEPRYRALVCGHYCYHVPSALDKGSRAQLMGSLARMGADLRLRPAIHNWLQMRTPAGNS